jgi:hypothetical protein
MRVHHVKGEAGIDQLAVVVMGERLDDDHRLPLVGDYWALPVLAGEASARNQERVERLSKLSESVSSTVQ